MNHLLEIFNLNSTIPSVNQVYLRIHLTITLDPPNPNLSVPNLELKFGFGACLCLFKSWDFSSVIFSHFRSNFILTGMKMNFLISVRNTTLHSIAIHQLVVPIVVSYSVPIGIPFPLLSNIPVSLQSQINMVKHLLRLYSVGIGNKAS